MDLTDDYVAGLFDGEGWFQIDRCMRRGCRRPSFQVHARICMRDADLLRALQSAFGGSLRRSAVATRVRAAYWSWDLCGEGVFVFAKRIGPRLHLKNRQARLSASFQELKRQNKNRPNSEERFGILSDMYTEMREYNRKGVSR